MANQNYIDTLAKTIKKHFEQVENTIDKCQQLQEAKIKYNQIFNALQSDTDVVEKNKEEFEQRKHKIKEVVKFLQKEIGTICDGYNTLEPLTISIFGEWGSGKTYILKGIKHYFLENIDDNEYLIIPIFFNAWRFEKEKHIIIPLFKTMLSELNSFTLQHKKAEYIYDKIKILTLALISSLELKEANITSLFSLFSGNFNNADSVLKFFNFKKLAKELKEDKDKKELLESINKEGLESVYLNIPKWIEKITIYDNVKFVFLIDDIDRCLPENALKMLESIKLFLDIPNCSFVLAIDDDIIERGVEHHYKEYKLDGNNKELPITGGEYLEKIVQLPFRIPNNDIEDAKEFLTNRFNRFKTLSINYEVIKEILEQQNKQNQELLEFFAKYIPNNPRKLIRAVTLFESKEELLKGKKYEPLFLAKLTLLELFAPKLYRYIKTKGFIRMFNRFNSWLNKYGDFYNKDIEKSIKELPNRDKQDFAKAYELIKELQKSRVEIDLEEILNTRDFKINSKLIIIHTQFKLPKTLKTNNLNLTKAYPKDIATFLERIFSKDPLLWESAFKDDDNLKNAILDDKAFKEFLVKSKNKFENKIIEPEWLEIVSKHLNKEQFITLIKELNPIDRLKNEK